MSAAPHLDIDALLDDRGVGVIVCCGSGGGGQDDHGSRACPPRRPTGPQRLRADYRPRPPPGAVHGPDGTGQHPRPVPGIEGGSLSAMMLDMKRTFDEIVIAHPTPNAPRRFWRTLLPSSSRVHSPAPRNTWRWRNSANCAPAVGRQGSWDLIVVDTPPVALRAGFPGCAQAAGVVPRRSPDPGPRRPSTRRGTHVGAGLQRLAGPVHQRAEQGHPERRCCVTCSCSSAVLMPCSGAGGARRSDVRAIAGPDTRFLVVAAPESDALREALILRPAP